MESMVFVSLEVEGGNNLTKRPRPAYNSIYHALRSEWLKAPLTHDFENADSDLGGVCDQNLVIYI